MIYQAGAEIWLEPRNPGQGSRASPFDCKLGRFIDHNYATDLRGYTLSAKCEGVPHRPSVKSASHMDEVCDDNTCGRAVDEHSDKCEVCSAHSPGPPMLGSCGDSPHLIGGSGGPRRVNGIANSSGSPANAPPTNTIHEHRFPSNPKMDYLKSQCVQEVERISSQIYPQTCPQPCEGPGRRSGGCGANSAQLR